jgi:hypothetical protein
MFCFKCGNKLDDNANFCMSCGAQIGNNTINGQTAAGGGAPTSNYAPPGQPGYYTQAPSQNTVNTTSVNQAYYQAQSQAQQPGPGGYVNRPAAPYAGTSPGIGLFKAVSFILPIILIVMLFFGWFTSPTLRLTADYASSFGYNIPTSYSIPQLLFSLGQLNQLAELGGSISGDYSSAIGTGMTIYTLIVVILSILIVIAIIAYCAYIYKSAQIKEYHTRKLRTVFICIDLVFILSLAIMIILNSAANNVAYGMAGTVVGLSIGAYITGVLSILATIIVPGQLRNELEQKRQQIMR